MFFKKYFPVTLSCFTFNVTFKLFFSYVLTEIITLRILMTPVEANILFFVVSTYSKTIK